MQSDYDIETKNDLHEEEDLIWYARLGPPRPSEPGPRSDRATSTYTAGTNQRLSHTRLAARRKRMRLAQPANIRIA